MLDEAILKTGEEGRGRDYPGSFVSKSRAARGALFLDGRHGKFSKRRDVVEFGPYRRIDDQASRTEDGGPDLDNAVSTFVVRSRPSARAGAPLYWVRKVRVIGFAEVFLALPACGTVS